MPRYFFSAVTAAVIGASLCACHRDKEGDKSAPKLKRQDILARAEKERLAINAFASSLREILEWRQTLPVPLADADRQAVLEKLQQVAIPANLPSSLADAWKQILAVSQQLSAAGIPKDSLRQQGASAAAELDRQLTSYGYPDLKF